VGGGGVVLRFAHFANDFVQAFDLCNVFHPEPLKIPDRELTNGLFYPSNCANAWDWLSPLDYS
jgi:hypothetical protein